MVGSFQRTEGWSLGGNLQGKVRSKPNRINDDFSHHIVGFQKLSFVVASNFGHHGTTFVVEGTLKPAEFRQTNPYWTWYNVVSKDLE